MRLITLIAVVVASSLVACATHATDDVPVRPTTKEARPPAPGSDRDAHGCIPSAGYQWCERTGKCERSWELAREMAFENSSKGFKAFCSAEPDPSSR